MGDFKKVVEAGSARDRVGAPLLISLFALVALMLGLSYLRQGMSTLIAIPSGQYRFFTLLIQLALTFFELLFGVASIVIAAGLFFRKEWARKAWLVFVLLTLLVGLYLTAIQFFAAYSGLAGVYVWIGLLILISAISWLYLFKVSTKARFH